MIDCLLPLVLWMAPAAPAAEGPQDFLGPQSQLAAWLLRSGRGKKAEAERLAETLREIEVAYLDGNTRCAASRYGAAAVDPSFTALAQTPLHDNVRYYLAGALAAQGATGRAREILIGLIKRKPPSSFRAPAFRKLVDISLHSSQLDQTLTALHGLGVDWSDAERAEIRYMQGKSLMALGFADKAAEALGSVDRQSRLFAPAVYLLGVLALQAGDEDKAEDQFCRLVHQPGGGRFTFFFSERSPRVLLNAWMALARVRHDRGDYECAFDTYARVPAGTPESARARYESAWSLFRLGRMARLRHRLGALSGKGTLRQEQPNIELLLAYSFIGDCLFDRAESILDGLERRCASLAGALSVMASSPAGSTSLPVEVSRWVPPSLEEQRSSELAESIEDSLQRVHWLRAELARSATGMVRKALDSPEARLASELHSDLEHTRYGMQRLAEMRAALGDASGEQNRLRQIEQLEQQIAEAGARARAALDRLNAGRLAGMPGRARPASGGDLPGAYLQAEIAGLAELGRGLAAQKARADALSDVAERSHLSRAAARVHAWARQAKLGRIDAVMGRKQALETEIENLALGRFPMSVLRELAESGQLDESYEYWPYDGEEWPDEFE